MKYIFHLILLSVLFMGDVLAPHAQTLPVVQIVFFFNPDCEICHQVMANDLPPLQIQYGDQLEILKIDTSRQDGIRLYQAMTHTFQLESDRLGTPAIIIGSTILVGGDEIPEKLPPLIESNLANGGVAWPNILGLNSFIAATTGSEQYPPPQLYPQPFGTSSDFDQSTETTIWDRFATNFKKDITANSLAVAILVVMIISLFVAVIILIRSILADNPQPASIKIPSWVIPLIIVIGIGIAAYMSFIEVGKKPALCGPVGHCNEVQNSPYAKLFGILPVGILGLLGYSSILIAWGTKTFGQKSLRTISAMSLWGLSLFGVAFSIYLTFLEPFVIGAACIWCLSSALVMTALLWVTTPGLQDMLVFEDEEEDEEEEDDLLEFTDDASNET